MRRSAVWSRSHAAKLSRSRLCRKKDLAFGLWSSLVSDAMSPPLLLFVGYVVIVEPIFAKFDHLAGVRPGFFD
jgi:hypothetical protein